MMRTTQTDRLGQVGMRKAFGRAMGVCTRIRAGQIIVDIGTYLKNLPLVRDRLRVASMKIGSTCQAVVIKYRTPKLLKKSGLPLYDAIKRREIHLSDLKLIKIET